MTTWQSVPIVVVPRPCCPHCGDAGYPEIKRSAGGGDGSMSRKCVCRSCGGRWVLLIDPDVPVAGKVQVYTR